MNSTEVARGDLQALEHQLRMGAETESKRASAPLHQLCKVLVLLTLPASYVAANSE